MKRVGGPDSVKAENANQNANSKRIEVTRGSTRASVSLNCFVFEIKENIFKELSANGLVALGRTCNSLQSETKEFNKNKLSAMYRVDNFYEPFIDGFPNLFKFNLNDSVLFYFYSLNNLDRSECIHFKKVFEYWLDRVLYLWIATGFQIERETQLQVYLIQNMKTSSSYLLQYEFNFGFTKLKLNTLCGGDLFILSKLIEVYFSSKKIIEDFRLEEKKLIILELIDLISNKRLRNDFSKTIIRIINVLQSVKHIYEMHQIYLEFEKRDLLKYQKLVSCSDKPLSRYCTEINYLIFYDENNLSLENIRRYFMNNQSLSDSSNNRNLEFLEGILDFIIQNKYKKEFSELTSDLVFHFGQQVFLNSIFSGYKYFKWFFILGYFVERYFIINKEKVGIFKDYIIKFLSENREILDNNGDNLRVKKDLGIQSILLLHTFLSNKLIILNQDEANILSDWILLLRLPLSLTHRFKILDCFNFCIFYGIISEIKEDAAQLLKNEVLNIIIGEGFHLSDKLRAFSLLVNFLIRNLSLLDLREILLLNKYALQCLENPQSSFLKDIIFEFFNYLLSRNNLRLDDEQIQFLKNYAILIIKNFKDLNSNIIVFLGEMLWENLIVLEESDLKILKNFLFSKIWYQNFRHNLLRKSMMIMILLSKQLLRLEEVDWQELKENIDLQLQSSEDPIFFLAHALLVLSTNPHIERDELFSYASSQLFCSIYDNINKNVNWTSKAARHHMREKYSIFLEHPEPMVQYYVREIIRLIESSNYNLA